MGLLVGCVEVETHDVSTLERATEALADIREDMSEDFEQSYFTTDSWHSFVDAYWQGYNEGQEYAKEPDYMDTDNTVY